MILVKALLFFTATLVVCQSSPVSKEDVNEESTRVLASLINYFISSWDDNSERVVRTQISTSTPFPEIASNTRITILVHGYPDINPATQFLTTLRNALLRSRPDSMVIEVDWSLFSSVIYAGEDFYIHFVGENLLLLLGIAGDNINYDLLHFVGHGLGAHMSGYVSRKGKARKITALDPERSIHVNSQYCLNSNDAEYVEVIHTNAGHIGIGGRLGTVDIYVNNGTSQPGCIRCWPWGGNDCGLLVDDNWCNHMRAVDIFLATVEYNGRLVAWGCSSMQPVTEDDCRNTPVITVGTDSIAHKLGYGYYRVNTGAVYPYYL